MTNMNEDYFQEDSIGKWIENPDMYYYRLSHIILVLFLSLRPNFYCIDAW